MKLRLVFGALALTVLATPVLGNGYDESRSWQFRTTGDRANLALILDLVERKKNGFFDSPTNYITNNTYFQGDQINCSVQASATGNLANNTQTASVGNASITPSQNNSANATGNDAVNTSSNTASQLNSVDQVGSQSSFGNTDGNSATDNDGSDFSVGSDDNNTYNPGGHSYTAQDLLNNNQTNNDSTISAGADNNTNTVNVGDTTTNATSSQALNNTQTNSGNQTATINDSTACTFSGQ